MFLYNIQKSCLDPVPALLLLFLTSQLYRWSKTTGDQAKLCLSFRFKLQSDIIHLSSCRYGAIRFRETL